MSVKFTYILDINLLNIAINHQMNEINTFLRVLLLNKCITNVI